MAGNILGGRSYYQYEGEDGTNYSLLVDDSNAAAMGMVADDSFPAPPRRFKPRVVFAEVQLANRVARKQLIAPTGATAAYASNTTTVVTVDGVAYNTTGRRGETLSFPRNSDALDPGDDDTPVATP